MSGIPLMIDLSAGTVRRLNTDCDLPGNTLTLDSDNAGAPADCLLVANQGTSPDGVFKFASATGRWEIVAPDTVYDALYINKAPSTAKAGNALTVAVGANATGHGISLSFDPDSAGDAVKLAVAGNARGVYIVDSGANLRAALEVARSVVGAAGTMVTLTRSPPSGSTGGHGIAIVHGAFTTGDCINLAQQGTGDALKIVVSHTGGQALVVTESTAGTNPMISLTRSTTGASGAMLSMNKDPAGSSSGNVIYISTGAAALSSALRIAHGGSGAAIEITNAGQVLVAADSGVCTATMVALTRSNAGSTGVMLSLTKNPGSATAGDLVSLTTGPNASGNVIDITHGGTGDALNIVLSHASGQALVVTESTVGTSHMIELTRSVVGATGAALRITRSPSGASAGDAVQIVMGANASGSGVYSQHAGAGAAFYASYSGSTSALFLSNTGTGNTLQCDTGTNEYFTVDATCRLAVSSTDANYLVEAYAANVIKFRLRANGNGTCAGSWTGGGADYAEKVHARQNRQKYEPGDVLVVVGRGAFDVSTAPCDTCIAGVMSTRPGFLGNDVMHHRDRRNVIPLAMLGIVPTKCTTEGGPIHPGTLLVTAKTRGHAMAASGVAPRGSILGKALGSLLGTGKRGLIPVYVNLQ